MLKLKGKMELSFSFPAITKVYSKNNQRWLWRGSGKSGWSPRMTTVPAEMHNHDGFYPLTFFIHEVSALWGSRHVQPHTNTLTGLDFNHGANWQLPTVLCRKSLRLNNYNRWLLLSLILYTIFLWQFNDRTTNNDPRVQFKEALNENWHWAVDLGYGSKAKMFCNCSFRSSVVTYG